MIDFVQKYEALKAMLNLMDYVHQKNFQRHRTSRFIYDRSGKVFGLIRFEPKKEKK